MGKFLDAIRKRREEIRQGRAQKAPDFVQDPGQGLAFQVKINDLLYIENHIRYSMGKTLTNMDPARQDQFYDLCIKEEAKASYTKEQFHQDLLQNNKLTEVLEGKPFGVSQDVIDETLDKLLNEQEQNALSQAVLDQKAPGDPQFPQEQKVERPYQENIEQMRAAIPANDPDAERKNRILNEADKILVDPSVDTLNYLQRQVSGFQDPDLKGLDDAMDQVSDVDVINFIENTLEGGKFKDKFPSVPGKYLPKRYDVQEMNPVSGLMTDEDIQELKLQKTNISPALKNTVLNVCSHMDQIGEDKYRNAKTTTVEPDGNGHYRVIFAGEQGEKYYAFWPIQTAKTNLAAAIENGDYAAAETAIADYNNAKAHTDEIMKSVQTGGKTFGGNVESTRAAEGKDITSNKVPLEYLEDTVGHNKANGMFCLYAYCKNAGQKVGDVLDDPIGSMSSAADHYRKINGISQKGHTGKLLVKAFSGEAAADMTGKFDHYIRSFGHGMDAVASMAGTKEERERIAGLTQIATGIAAYELRKERNLWESLTGASNEKQNIVYTHAALLPEEDFDLLDIAGKLNQPDWEQQMDPNALIARLKTEGKLDFGRMADQADRMLEEAEAQKDSYDQLGTFTKYNDIRFRVNASKAYKMALKTATPEEQQTEGYRRLQQKAVELQNGAWADVVDGGTVADNFTQLDQQIAALDREKTGFLIDKTNSPEHQIMMKHLHTVQNKVKLLRGEEVPGLTEQERTELNNADLSELVHQARTAANTYQQIKTENGTKTRFWYTDGASRAGYAGNAVALLDEIETSMETQDPAILMMQKAQNDMIRDMNGNQRTPENISRTAAKLMSGMMMVHQKKTPSQQNAMLKPARFNANLRQIEQSPEFRRMMANEGPAKIAQYICEGNSKLTDAYAKAANEIRAQRGEQVIAPARMTADQKKEMWKQEGERHEQQAQPNGPVA